MTNNKQRNQKRNETIGIATLKEGLSTLKVAELHDIRRKLQIKNASSLKKAELIHYLAKVIPILLSNIVCQFDERRLFLIRKIIANNGVISENNLEIEEIEYVPKTGFMFTGDRNGEQVIMIPVELLPALEEIIQEGKTLSTIKRNTEWIKITRGLLYYYGTVPFDRLVEMVHKYAPIYPDFLDYTNIVYDAVEYYQEIITDEYGWSYWEVRNPLSVLEEQASRNSVDYYPFTKKQLIEAGEVGYIEHPKGFTQLVSRLVHEYMMAKQEAVEFAEDCIIHVNLGHHPGQILQYMQTRLQFESLEAAQRFMDTLVFLMNNTRQWYLKGYTSEELYSQEKQALKPLPSKKGEVIHFQSRKKVGRNDPCPCGSGKKFKKCCGGN